MRRDCVDPPVLQQDFRCFVEIRHVKVTHMPLQLCVFYLRKQELLKKGTIVIATYTYALEELPLCSKLQCLYMGSGP